MEETRKKIHSYIDAHLDEHVEKIKELVRIPSVAAEDPEGTRRCAEYVQRWFAQLGCVSKIFETQGQPVVFGEYDAEARNTLIIYLMYDVKQVGGEIWTLIEDPFKPQILEVPPFKKVLVGRGTYNTKGPMAAFLNALDSIRACG